MRALRTILACAVLVTAASPVAVGSAVAGTLERVRDAGSLTIGYRADAIPYSYRDENDQPAGFIVDLCREVAVDIGRHVGLDSLTTAYVTVTAENRFEAVTEGRVDLLCEPTTVTAERRELVDFSLPTFVDGASVLFRADGPAGFDELTGEKVGVRAGTTTETGLKSLLAELGVEAEVVPVPDHRVGVIQVADGEFAAYFADRAILVFLLEGHDRKADLRLSEQFFSHETYGLAMERGDTDFRLVVDRSLAELYRSGRVDEIFAANFGEAQPSSVLETMFIIHAMPDE